MSETNQLQPITMGMFWPLLLQAAGNEYNVNWHPIPDQIHARTGVALDSIFREDVAEEMAREHFPSGMINGNGWSFYVKSDSLWDVFKRSDTDPESFSEVCEAIQDPLSPRDPAHVAMVMRVLAISHGLPVYVEGPNLEIKHNQRVPNEDGEPTDKMGFLIRFSRTRPRMGDDHTSPLSVGLYLAYRAGENAASLDVGVAVFRWMIERYAEIVKALAAEDAADAESNPAT